MAVIYRPKGRAQEYSLLAINHYEGCGHLCNYCYVAGMPQWKDRDFFSFLPVIREDVLNHLVKEAPKYAGTDERVLLCFTCDPYQPLDTEVELTREVIKILKQWNIPFQVLTKGGTSAIRDFDLYGSNDAFATTLTFLTDGKSLKIEPHAAPPFNRIEAIKIAHEKGIQTWVSLEPVIEASESLKIIECTHGFVDHFKIGKLNHHHSEINWRRFGKRAIELCRHFETDYQIKLDLAQYLDGIPFHSVDTRKIKRAVSTVKQGGLFEL